MSVLYLFVLFLLVQLELRLVSEGLRAVGAAVGLDARVTLHVRPQTLLACNVRLSSFNT